MSVMKTSLFLSLAVFAAAAPLLQASESKRTAEYILATPTDFEGKEVTLDVAFVKPVHWKSPVPELAFFHAITLDRREHKNGGGILVAILAADAGKFSKRYGLNFENRSESNILTGTLVAAPGGGPGGPNGRVWLIDTTGQANDLIKANKLSLHQGAGQDNGGGFGPGNGGGGFGPRKHGPGPN